MIEGYIALGAVAAAAFLFSVSQDNPDSALGKLLGRGFGYVRWPVAVVTLAALLLVTWGAIPLEHCQDQLVEGQSETTVDLCRDLGFTDPAIVTLFILLALTLAPEFSEFSVAGLITLKNRVQKMEEALKLVGEGVSYAEFPDTPEKTKVYEELLEEVKSTAEDFLKEKGFDFEGENIKLRTNMFFLDYRSEERGHAGELVIPRGLGPAVDEKEIKLRPGQGSTGLAFESKKLNVAWAEDRKKNGKPIREWDRPYGLERRILGTDGSSKDYHYLRWIISTPIVATDAREGSLPVAVVNVDFVEKPGATSEGLTLVTSTTGDPPEALEELAQEIWNKHSDKFQEMAKQHPRVRVHVAFTHSE